MYTRGTAVDGTSSQFILCAVRSWSQCLVPSWVQCPARTRDRAARPATRARGGWGCGRDVPRACAVPPRRCGPRRSGAGLPRYSPWAVLVPATTFVRSGDSVVSYVKGYPRVRPAFSRDDGPRKSQDPRSRARRRSGIPQTCGPPQVGHASLRHRARGAGEWTGRPPGAEACGAARAGDGGAPWRWTRPERRQSAGWTEWPLFAFSSRLSMRTATLTASSAPISSASVSAAHTADVCMFGPHVCTTSQQTCAR